MLVKATEATDVSSVTSTRLPEELHKFKVQKDDIQAAFRITCCISDLLTPNFFAKTANDAPSAFSVMI